MRKLRDIKFTAEEHMQGLISKMSDLELLACYQSLQFTAPTSFGIRGLESYWDDQRMISYSTWIEHLDSAIRNRKLNLDIM